MPTLTQQIPNFNVKIVFLAHFIFISLSCMGFWASNAYLFYNCILIFLLLWSIFHGQVQEPLQLAIVVNGVSILLDILLLIMNFPSYNSGAAAKFSAAMAILHLLVRPFSTFVLIKNLEERGGAPANIPNMFTGTRTESYEDIDRTSVPQSSAQSGGYNFATAQPI
ncbi:type-1 angiotensin II receptor-associated protein isoform X1 [Euwallacea fornicatus]|uniref:type-1 angiotensin II receptor-associated protein isoform X1 n=1 Tax=Euwallacea fornicatus TaxID=995702 RepID=UPI00339074E9